VASAPAAVAAASSASGTFAVQLAGTTSEDEARDALGRLTRRFASELGSYRPAVVRAESGSRTVYRVRVSNLSNEDANTLCARLKAGGGTCFVARN
jgi:cell division septation protein DedD